MVSHGIASPPWVVSQDYICFRYIGKEYTRREKGRLKLCSRSLVFEPDATNLPIIKMSYKLLNSQPAPHVWPRDHQDYEMSSFKISVGKVYEMKEDDVVGPYKERVNRGGEGSLVVFTLPHTSADTILPFIGRLHKMALGGSSDQGAALEMEKVVKERHLIDFDRSLLVDFRERALIPSAILVTRVKPLINNPGCIMLTDSQLYFQPASLNNIGEVVANYPLGKIMRVLKRRYLLRHVGVEVFIGDTESVFFAFQTRSERDQFFDRLIDAPGLKPSAKSQVNALIQEATVAWQKGNIDNYDYVMYLNSMADRSFSDLTQYPVMPWVIKDYDSPSLNLDSATTFRDLSKPIGALNPKRLQAFKDRYEDMPTGPGLPPPFLYGTHYSTPGYVLFYLVRERPEWMLCLQNGKFDAPDRLFHGIKDAWNGVLENPSDLKELIPEFYSGNGDFLANTSGISFGKRHNGESINHCHLPPWASSPSDFVSKCRSALESEYVSNHLHEWVDLIFGYKQQGAEALKHDNLFYYLTYEGAVDLDNVNDVIARKSYETQIREFGQTPRQLFKTPHPPRGGVAGEYSPLDWASNGGARRKRSSVTMRPTMPLFEVPSSAEASPRDRGEGGPAKKDALAPSLLPPSSPPPFTSSSISLPAAVSTSSTSSISILSRSPAVVMPWTRMGSRPHWRHLTREPFHRSDVNGVCLVQGGETIISASSDSYLKVFSLSENRLRRNVSISDLALSACASVDDSGNSIVCGSWDNNIYLYEVDTARVVDKLSGHHDAISCLSLRDGVVLTGSWDASAKLWRVREGGFEEKTTNDDIDADSQVSCVDLDHCCNLAIVGTVEGQVIMTDIRSPPAVELVSGTGDAINTIKWSRDGHKFVTGSMNGVLNLHQGDGLLLVSIETKENLRSMIASDDLQYVITAGSRGVLRLWDMVAEEEIKVAMDGKLPPLSEILSCGVSSGGDKIVVGLKNGSVDIYSK